jgi:hypothetical protein
LNLDIRPLVKLVYTNGDLDDDYIASCKQLTSELILLVQTIVSEIYFTEVLLKKPMVSPWREYILSGELMEHLKLLLKTLKCYQANGYDEVILTAG